jgi:alkylation response protein AidB-like acyl-CoA dehydrogenase
MACVPYLLFEQDRKSMGQPISNHQAISMKLADMACRVDAARLLTYRAAAYKDAVS